LSLALPGYAAPDAEYGKLSKTYTLYPDGSQEFRCSMELTLFTHTAMNRTYGESFIVYNPRYQELKIHASYTKQKDGTIIQTPENALVEVLPRQAANAPAYTHLKEMVVVHTGLELGATIYLDYSVVSKAGYLPALDVSEIIEQSSPVREYTLTLVSPENKPLSFNLVNSTAKAIVSTANGMKQAVWKLRNVPAAPKAPQVTVDAGGLRQLTASSYASIADALSRIKEQLNLSDNAEVEALSETLTNGKDTDAEKIGAILDYVINRLGNSRLTLQEAGYRIRPAGEVIRTAYGTVAEKVNLLAALLNVAGIKAEVAASFYHNNDLNSCGLSAIDELFVIATCGGKNWFLTPLQPSLCQTGWLAGYRQVRSVSGQGEEIAIAAPPAYLNYAYEITIGQGKSESRATATVADAFLPYTGAYVARLTAGGKEAEETKGEGHSLFTYTLSGEAKEKDGYILFRLPDSPIGFSHTPYDSYNTVRKEPLLLSRKADERYRYTIHIPDDFELCTPEGERVVNQSAGSVAFSVRQREGVVEVSRTLTLHRQLIAPSEYAGFRRLAAEWADPNALSLLFKRKNK
jgi:hypothetical protein